MANVSYISNIAKFVRDYFLRRYGNFKMAAVETSVEFQNQKFRKSELPSISRYKMDFYR